MSNRKNAAGRRAIRKNDVRETVRAARASAGVSTSFDVTVEVQGSTVMIIMKDAADLPAVIRKLIAETVQTTLPPGYQASVV